HPVCRRRAMCQESDWQGLAAGGIIVASDDGMEVTMRKRRDPSASEDDGPKLISLQDKHDADRLLHQAFEAGELDEEELKRRRGRVYAAVTPRELWKATDHRAGSRERADKAEIRRSLRLQLAIVGFAVVIMMFVLLGTIINNQGGTVDTPIFPWEWGSGD
ncbi:MAG TPA: DUF1707 domain-containing protein, partial [Actinomycetes bacterium]|nr:DUF1707 domain-containing protein [Actinomycetes bacterium]